MPFCQLELVDRARDKMPENSTLWRASQNHIHPKSITLGYLWDEAFTDDIARGLKLERY